VTDVQLLKGSEEADHIDKRRWLALEVAGENKARDVREGRGKPRAKEGICVSAVDNNTEHHLQRIDVCKAADIRCNCVEVAVISAPVVSRGLDTTDVRKESAAREM
jgi:hypothetical protein